jgi:hypothetical protein
MSKRAELTKVEFDRLEALLRFRLGWDSAKFSQAAEPHGKKLLADLRRRGPVAHIRSVLGSRRSRGELRLLYDLIRTTSGTAESLALEPEFAPLFTAAEKAVARRRLHTLFEGLNVSDECDPARPYGHGSAPQAASHQRN